MRSNIERRSQAVEQRPEVESADLDYDDGEVVLIALCEKFGDDFERFLDQHGLDVRSGPKHVGLGLEVVLA